MKRHAAACAIRGAKDEPKHNKRLPAFQGIPKRRGCPRGYLESRLWPDGVRCAKCKAGERITPRKNGFYRCNSCKKDFPVRTGTIFERSHVPLRKWLCAIYLLVTARKGISSMQLAKEIGITQKSAWFVLQRLREACGHETPKLRGTVEIDEVYWGGKEQNKHMSKRLYGDRGVPAKTAVVGMRERGGRTKTVPVGSTGGIMLDKTVRENIEIGATLHTDENAGYQRLAKDCNHQTVNHSLQKYVENGVTTNSIESVFTVMRRGLHGVYHHASKKHIRRYVNEFVWRPNAAPWHGTRSRGSIALLTRLRDAESPTRN